MRATLHGHVQHNYLEVHRLSFFFLFFFFHLTYSQWTSSLPSCLWSQRIFPSLPGSRLTIFLPRCKFSTHLTYSRWTSSLPSCLWSKDLPISPRFTPYIFFIVMQVQHSYNSSTNGWILLTHVPTLSVTKERTQILLW